MNLTITKCQHNIGLVTRERLINYYSHLKVKRVAPQLPQFMDTSVLVFCLYPIQAPHCSLLLLLEPQHSIDDCERSTCLWMSNQVTESWLFLLYLLCFWVDVAYSPVLNVLKPGGSRTWADAKAFRDTVLSEASEDVVGWHEGSTFAWVSFCSRVNRMHGRGGAKWATIPSLTLVEQKMSHASSQS